MQKDYIEIIDEDQDETSFVEEYWTSKWEGRTIPSSDAVLSREEFQLMKPYLTDLAPGAKILDGGCGMGAWTVCLSDLGFDVTGIDLSQETVFRLNTMLTGYRFETGDIRNLHYADDTFDAYFSWGTFEHFESGLGPCIEEACRVIKPGGYLFITVPYQNLRHILRGAHHLSDGGRTRFYQWRLTRKELTAELQLRGFDVRSVTATARSQGVHRFLEWDLPIFRTGTLPFRVLRRALTPFVPSGWMSHMLFAAAQKST